MNNKNKLSKGNFRGPMMMPTEKPKDFKDTVKKLLDYLGSYKITMAIIILLAIISTVFSIVGPKIMGNATTELFNGVMSKIAGTGSVNFTKIGNILVWLVGLYLISTIFSLIQGFMLTSVSNKLTYRMRKDIDEKIHKLPFSYYDTTTNGEVLSRITNDVDTVNQSFNQSITQIITSITMLIGILIMMFSISLPISLIVLTILPLSFIVIVKVMKKSQKHFVNQQKYLGEINSIVEENYSAHNIVKAFNGEEKSLENFSEKNDILYHSSWKAHFLSGLLFPIMSVIGNINYIVVCIVGGYYATKGRIKIGDIQAFIQYARQFMQPIGQISQISNVLQQTIAAAERIFAFLEEQEEIPEIDNALEVCKPKEKECKGKVKIKGNVIFDDIYFGYKKDKTIIHGFNAKVKTGQKIAIVGPTGAGKSTIVKLLMRFYDVDKGKILLDGYNINDFKRDDLRSVFGMVLQDTWLYNGSIADNIRYGNLNASDDEVIEAAKAAQVDNFVRTLPNGYDMILNEEASNISQGQKQLLTIARAILADPKVLILDEATSSVDTRTEILIQKAMDHLMEGRTSFIIAHRLSTIKNADLILVMNDGDIIEQGTHNELMKKNGFYAKLYNSQFTREYNG